MATRDEALAALLSLDPAPVFGESYRQKQLPENLGIYFGPPEEFFLASDTQSPYTDGGLIPILDDGNFGIVTFLDPETRTIVQKDVECPFEELLAMTSRQALAFIRKHGVVLEAAQGPVPSLVEVIAGEAVRGSWWSHPKSHEIFAVTRAIRDSNEVLVCRLIKGKITFVHRRIWPALVRLAGRFPLAHLSRVSEVHTSSGRHVTKKIPFPDWVPSSVRAMGSSLSEEAAVGEFAAWLELRGRARPTRLHPTAATRAVRRVSASSARRRA